MQSRAIMIVDDNETLSAAFLAILNEQGFAVRTARNGVEAARLCETAPPDLAIVDLKMPELDGPGAIEALYHFNPDVRVIAISGCMLGPYFSRLSRLGVRRFLPKPFSTEHLLREIRDVLTANGEGEALAVERVA